MRNNGGRPVSALNKPPTLKLETPKIRKYTPLDSDAIATEYGARGQKLFQNVLHSADYKYIADSIWTPGVFVPTVGGGNAFLGGFPAFAHYSPDWQARIDARNSAMSILAKTQATQDKILAYKPGETTIAPNDTQTFIAYFPYCKFKTCTLKVLLGNTVIEFPFTDKSG